MDLKTSAQWTLHYTLMIAAIILLVAFIAIMIGAVPGDADAFGTAAAGVMLFSLSMKPR